jgi:hypothetical protein
VLRNPALETLLRTSDKPDLHVVLYAGGADSPTVVGRLNIPTIWREPSEAEFSTEVRAPGFPGGDLRGEFQPGWAYVVQLTGNMRACCDGGDNACRDIPWDQQVPEGTASPAIVKPLETTATERELNFSLSSAEIADNVQLDPDATAQSPFLIKAAKVQDGSVAKVDGAAVSCRLDTREKKLAEGALQLQAGADRRGQVNRVSAGTLQLKYQTPKN